MQGKTQSGFEFDIDEGKLDDYELLQALYAIDNGKADQIVYVVNALLGEEQEKKLKDHIRDKESGKVSISGMISHISEIFRIIKPKK